MIFLFFYIHWSNFKDLPNPHPTSCHELKYQSVANVSCLEYHLINSFFFEYGPLNTSGVPEYLSQHHGITRVGDLLIQSVLNEIEEGIEQCISKAFGSLLGLLIKVGQKGENFLRGY